MVKLWQVSVLLSVVSAWRQRRKDAISKKCAAAAFTLGEAVSGKRTEPLCSDEEQQAWLLYLFMYPTKYRCRLECNIQTMCNIQTIRLFVQVEEGCEDNSSSQDAQRATSSRQMQRMTSARDWTLDEIGVASGELPAGFCKRCVRLAAPDALHPCNQQIPVTMVWHSDHQSSEAMARALPCSSCDMPIDETQELNESCPDPPAKLPVVIWLHATNGSIEAMMPRLITYAGKGYLAVAIDCRCASHSVKSSLNS